MMKLKGQRLFNLLRNIFSLLVISILSFTGVIHAQSANNPPADGSFPTIPISIDYYLPELDNASIDASSAHPKMDSAVTSVAEAFLVSEAEALLTAQRNSFRIASGKIQVQIVVNPQDVDFATALIARSDGEVTGYGFNSTLLQAWIPASALGFLVKQDEILFVQKPAELVLDEIDEIDTTTEGLAVSNGNAWHAAGFTGSGVKVGIIDGGFEGYPSLLGSDLPSAVTVKNFVDGESDAQVNGTTIHGTACAEIVYDFVPDASIYLAKINTTVDLEEAVTWMRDTNHVDVITTSLSFFNISPGDGTGDLADLIQATRNAGILWTKSAGNYREMHWGGAWADPDSDNYLNFNGDQEINYFGPGDGNAYSIGPGYTLRIYLRWNDWTSVNQNFNLHLARWNGSAWNIIASSTNSQNGSPGQTPTEVVAGVTSGDATAYGFLIERISSSWTVNFEALAPNTAHFDEFLFARSLGGMADAPAAFTVAALDVNSPYPQESYSSEGPTNGPGGSAGGGFTKPDISGFANVSTASYGSGSGKFNGTSAATPHVAGASALVLSAYPSYTPDQLQSFLEGRAIDMGPGGKDNQFGSGRLYLGSPPAAAGKTWTGSASQDWHTAQNWSPEGVPGSSDDVVIPVVANQPVISTADAAVNNLTVNQGVVLDMTRRVLTVEGSLSNNGTIKQTADVTTGVTSEFLRIKNQAGTQTKYYGVDINPTSIGSLANNQPKNLDQEGTEIPLINQSGSEKINLIDRQPPQSDRSRNVELRIDSISVEQTGFSKDEPLAPDVSVPLVLDDGSLESAYGVNNSSTGKAHQFIWFNRFTPNPSDYPFSLNEIRVMFDNVHIAGNVHVGDAIDLVVYQDADGNPTNGASWLATYPVTVQAVDGVAWSVYPLSSPLTINGPGDVLIAVINRYVESGVTTTSYPATFDTTSGQDRSWIGWWTEIPPNPAILPPTTLELLTGDSAGNWLVRGYGETIPTVNHGIYGQVTYNGSPAPGINLILRFYNGSSWSTWGSPVTTDSNGDYIFTGVPSLTSGQVYYVRYDNGANGNLDVTNYLSSWRSFQLSSYTSGSDVHGGDFDIADIKLASPSGGAMVTLPTSFTWTRRTTTTSDSYTFNLYDPSDGDPAFESAMLGYVNQYTLNSLPPGFLMNTQYAWYMMVYAPDNGYGYPYYARYITFQDSGGNETEVTVAVSGHQKCADRNSGVERCFDITPSATLNATVRFYFEESEKNSYYLDELIVFHKNTNWTQEPGPYTRGGGGLSYFVEAENVDEFSLFALDSTVTTRLMYLPLVDKNVGPPIPPTLYDINNADGNGDYTVSWSSVSTAETYTLVEDDNSAFSSPETVYQGTATSTAIHKNKIGTYYYRVRGENFKGAGDWSGIKSAKVNTEPPLVCETHPFGDPGTTWYVYSSGKTWNMTATNTMALENVEVRSNLATLRGLTFTIRVKINGTTIATWSQYVNDNYFKFYINTANVSANLNAGDQITYFISAPAGSGEAAIRWDNYVKLCGR